MVYIDSYVRCLQISADICRYYEGKCVQYTIILSARGTTTMFLPPHADRVLPKDQLRLLRSSRLLRLRRCSPPPLSRRHLAPSSSRPPSPRGASTPFLRGTGGCRCCRRHLRSCSPRRQGDAQRRRHQDGGRRQALPGHHLPCPSPLATLS